MTSRRPQSLSTSDLPDFRAMSIDQIEDFRIAHRETMREHRAAILASNEVYRNKIAIRDIAAQMRLDITNMTEADAEYLAETVRRNSRPPAQLGDVTATPDATQLTAEAGGTT